MTDKGTRFDKPAKLFNLMKNPNRYRIGAKQKQ